MNVWVIGASSGIGKALVGKYCESGNNVLAVGRKKEQLTNLENGQQCRNLKYYVCDITDKTEVKNLFEEKNIYSPDVIVVSAGIRENDTETDFNIEKFNKNLATNFMGAMNIANEVIEKDIKCYTIVLSSISAIKPNPESIGYCTSKAAISMAYRALNSKYACLGQKFGVIYLGPVATDMWEGKKSFMVMSLKQATNSIYRAIDKRKSIAYIPLRVFIPLFVFGLIPDTWYSFLTKKIFK